MVCETTPGGRRKKSPPERWSWWGIGSGISPIRHDWVTELNWAELIVEERDSKRFRGSRLGSNPTITDSQLLVKNLPATQETWVRSLGQKDPLYEMTTHSSMLAWRIWWTEEPGRLQSLGSQRVRHNWASNNSFPDSKVYAHITKLCLFTTFKITHGSSPFCRRGSLQFSLRSAKIEVNAKSPHS